MATEAAETTTEEKVDTDTKGQVYELGFHLLPTLSEEEVVVEFGKLKTSVESLGAVCISEASPKRTSLAYTIVRKENSKNTKYETAYFGWIKFETSPENSVALKEAVDNNKNVLRFLLIKTVREAPRMTSHRPLMYTKPSKPLRVEPKPEERAQKVSDEELDKSIEELVKE